MRKPLAAQGIPTMPGNKLKSHAAAAAVDGSNPLLPADYDAGVFRSGAEG